MDFIAHIPQKMHLSFWQRDMLFLKSILMEKPPTAYLQEWMFSDYCQSNSRADVFLFKGERDELMLWKKWKQH